MGFLYTPRMWYIDKRWKETIHPIDNYEIPGLLPRIGSCNLDIANFYFCLFDFVFLSVALSLLRSQPYANSTALVDDHIHYAQLAKKTMRIKYVAL